MSLQFLTLFQEFISNGRISKQSLLVLSQMSGNGSISPSANDQERKLVSALSHHIMYRKQGEDPQSPCLP